MERYVYLNGTLCIFQKDDIFPICNNSFKFIAQGACDWIFLIAVQ